jgi:hypothetical protein
MRMEVQMANVKDSVSSVKELLPIRRKMLFQLALGQPLDFSGNTTWEEITCVGYNPQSSTLEAVVAIKQASGYSGGLCFPGSKEFVRFFIDYGAGFEDLGYTSFDVHDIPDSPAAVHPIEYIVQLPLPDTGHRRCCGTAIIPQVRAVLSWNTVPSTDPNLLNAFGNRRDAHIQLLPRPFSLACLIESGVLNGGVTVLKQLDLEKPLQKVPQEPGALIQDLAHEYKEAKVHDHRLLTPLLKPLLSQQTPTYPISSVALKDLSKLGIDLNAAVKALDSAQADETYEQLTCAGLQTSMDTVGAVIQIKRPLGYSGDLCQAGSKEYVAFWADWNNNGTFDQYLGTASVDVHDLGGALPADGVRYSVSLLVPSIVQHLRQCGSPNVIRLRAVLSWSTAPSTTDPDALETWGNRLDVHVQIRPGQASQGLTDLIYRVGSVALSDISLATHLAYPSTVITGACGAPAMDRPWGGLVTIQGRIYNTGFPGSVRFRVRYKRHTDADIDSNWTPVTGSQNFVLMNPVLPPPSEVYVSQVAVTEPGLGGGWFDYVENPVASPPIFERDNRLADWNTGSLEGDVDLRLEYRRTVDPPGFYHQSNVVSIKLHNYQMVASTAATSAIDFTKDLDLVIDGGDCHSYSQSATITGHLRVVDPYFYTWSLDLQPATHTHGAAASPSCRTYTTLSDSGDGNLAWSLNTTKLDKCGYTLTLLGYDRTILNSSSSSAHGASKAVGFAVI